MKKIMMLCAALNVASLVPTFSSAFDVTQDPGHTLFPNVTKVDNNLYTSPMAAHPELRLVMERVTDINIHGWRNYTQIQSNSRVSTYVSNLIDKSGNRCQKGAISAGSYHANMVLENVFRENNEIWITYITADKEARHSELGSYNATDVMKKGTGTFANNLKMYMTVTSSAGALLTSHLGIAASAEGVVQDRPKGISVDLHSFAAKVMLMRNPDRRFMVNAPVHAMENILKSALPGDALFVGTKIYKQIPVDTDIAFDDFKALYPDLVEKAHDAAQQYIDNCYKKFSWIKEDEANMRKSGRYSEEDITTHKEQLFAGYELDRFLKEKEETFVVLQDKVDHFIKRQLERDFQSFKEPRLISRFALDTAEGSSSEMIVSEDEPLDKEHPPIISADGVTFIKERFAIDHPALHLDVTADHSDYKWLFPKHTHAEHIFNPAARDLHLIAVDLMKLAGVR